MSRNYDNWERLVKAVLKRDQIWQLCHQDSISICSDSSSNLDLSFPVSLGSFGIAADIFEFQTSNLATLWQHVQEYFGRGPKAVIKFLDSVNVTEREFEQQMTTLRSFSWHENVKIPWAYYFSKATKIVVYDYYIQGSVHDMLHGNGSTRPSWEVRARIALGAARGIAHVHAQCGGELVHGNINSSNIFLNQQQYGCVSVLGLKSGRSLQKKDVYSFGLLLLELVTSTPQEPGIVDRLLKLEPNLWDPDCFNAHLYVDELDLYEKPIREFPFVDEELKVKDPSVNQELRKTLRVAKRCLAVLPQDRPTMSEVVSMLHGDKPELIGPATTKKRIWHRFLPFNRSGLRVQDSGFRVHMF